MPWAFESYKKVDFDSSRALDLIQAVKLQLEKDGFKNSNLISSC